MGDAAIRVEGLSKSYVIGHDGADAGTYSSLRDTLSRGVRNALRRTGDMLRGRPIVAGDDFEEVWALRDVSFTVKQGERLGIIGRNGAGKSTLLKILSRITEPTRGSVRIAGRVASLLEVGTGFHQELSGRENIYLNGTILGMSRREIRRKFDEIVAFAEVERYLDTPVKRYSSGMYVRLAFAVAAHLEPDILVVDEVLAVGDAQFQKKCLGKMKEVGREGRTVLFVSHNMGMISSLCDKALHLDEGSVKSHGPCGAVIMGYVGAGENSPASLNYRGRERQLGDGFAQLLAADVRDERGEAVSEVQIDRPCTVRMEYAVTAESHRVYVPNFHFFGPDGTCAFVTNAAEAAAVAPGERSAECHLPANFLNDGLYSVRLALTSFESGVCVHFDEPGAITFNVRDPIEGVRTRGGYSGPMPGVVRPLLRWTLSPIN